MPGEDQGLVGHVGPVQIDWPRTLGYFGGAAAAVAFGVVEAPLGLVIAAAPFARLLNNPRTPRQARFVGQVVEGAVMPIGGEDDGIIQISSGGGSGGSGGSGGKAKRSSSGGRARRGTSSRRSKSSRSSTSSRRSKSSRGSAAQ